MTTPDDDIRSILERSWPENASPEKVETVRLRGEVNTQYAQLLGEIKVLAERIQSVRSEIAGQRWFTGLLFTAGLTVAVAVITILVRVMVVESG